MLKKFLIVLVVLGVGALFGYFIGYDIGFEKSTDKTPEIAKDINSFEECEKAGNPIMESYPRQCRSGDKVFTEEIGDEMEKSDLIIVDTPRPNSTVTSPLTVSGKARGNWYFEASFPIYLYDEAGNEIAMAIAQADGEWMTTEFVPFSVTLTYDAPVTPDGELVLRKDNPSGLPENDDELSIPLNLK